MLKYKNTVNLKCIQWHWAVQPICKPISSNTSHRPNVEVMFLHRLRRNNLSTLDERFDLDTLSISVYTALQNQKAVSAYL